MLAHMTKLCSCFTAYKTKAYNSHNNDKSENTDTLLT